MNELKSILIYWLENLNKSHKYLITWILHSNVISKANVSSLLKSLFGIDLSNLNAIKLFSDDNGFSLSNNDKSSLLNIAAPFKQSPLGISCGLTK